MCSSRAMNSWARASPWSITSQAWAPSRHIDSRRSTRTRPASYASRLASSASVSACGEGSGDGGPALGPGVALSNEVGQLDVAPNGDLYIADTGNNRIRRLERSTGRLSTVVGDGVPRSVGDLGPAVEASVNRPIGVKFVVAPGNAVVGGQRQYLYVTEVDRVRKILLN